MYSNDRPNQWESRQINPDMLAGRMETVNGEEVVFVSATFSSQQCIPDELLQVISSLMNPVSIIFNLFSISRHLGGLHTQTIK